MREAVKDTGLDLWWEIKSPDKLWTLMLRQSKVGYLTRGEKGWLGGCKLLKVISLNEATDELNCEFATLEEGKEWLEKKVKKALIEITEAIS